VIEKAIDINQRIPLAILEAGLLRFLKDDYDNGYIEEQLRLDFKGENRIRKATRIVKKVITGSPLKELLMENRSAILRAMKIPSDRNIILISLLNSTFLFSFDSLRILGELFYAQPLLSREALTRELVKAYGGNRSTANAIDSVVPMFIEAQFFTRPRLGFYEWQKPLIPLSPITKRLYIESFKVNMGIEEMPPFHESDPYFTFIAT
jgi:hypothetical protein